jgi:hypothetical protein
VLDRIQEHLEAIYGVRCEYRARDFLVDFETAKALGGTGRNREELLVSHDGEHLDLALYLEPEMLKRVTSFEAAPNSALDDELGGFCEVTEGVSHFLYLTQTAQLERTVSLLELEAQAEVDKFAICLLMRWGRDGAGWATSLMGRLFQRVRFNEQLSADERWRYVEANRLAKTYVARLMGLVRDGQLERLLGELRHAYRLGAEAKLQYFSRAR